MHSANLSEQKEKHTKRAVVVLTVNPENQNFESIIQQIFLQEEHLQNYNLQLLIIANSDKNNFAAIEKLKQIYHSLYFVKVSRKSSAYGLKYALKHLNPDVLIKIDQNCVYNPFDIPRFLKEIENGHDLVIGERRIRKHSVVYWQNLFAGFMTGTRVKDFTCGYMAITAEYLKKFNLKKIGYSNYFLKAELLKHKGSAKHIPVQSEGQEKAYISEIGKLILYILFLRSSFFKKLNFILRGILLLIAALGLGFYFHMHKLPEMLIIFLTIFSLCIGLQAALTLWWMIYAWDHPEEAVKNKSPEVFTEPTLSFSVIVPARHEEKVIFQTLRSLANINYPEELKEILIACKSDDIETIKVVQSGIRFLGKTNIKLVVFDNDPINKPHALNEGLRSATKDIVVVFDAEDDPHRDIFNIANTVMTRERVDVLQSGVQLMNYQSTWFSTLNILEYFFWFKSTLQFFAKAGIIPLGGNTVFIKRSWIEYVGGWDEMCLTEDADMGIRLSLAGAKMRIVYDEKHVTKEESPVRLSSFIRQRTRWNQGFMQIFLNGQFSKLPKLSQKLLGGYILISPELQIFLLIYAIFSLIVIYLIKLPAWLVLLSTIPFYILVLQILTYCIGLYIFTKDYKKKFSLWLPLKIFLTFIPYQIVLDYSAVRAIFRLIKGNYGWEKTQHMNAHRKNMMELI